MNPQTAYDLRSSIKVHEELRLRLYKDSRGITSIGWGRNIQDDGISEDEAELMLTNDINKATTDLHIALSWTKNLGYVRQAVLIEMYFNMGNKLLGFSKMLDFVHEGDYKKASEEMLNSEWANQVHERADNLAKVMESGSYR